MVILCGLQISPRENPRNQKKLLGYVQREQITPEKICNEETIQWTVTTPLDNIGEHVYNLLDEFKKNHPKFHGLKLQDYSTGWCITMRIPVGS